MLQAYSTPCRPATSYTIDKDLATWKENLRECQIFLWGFFSFDCSGLRELCSKVLVRWFINWMRHYHDKNYVERNKRHNKKNQITKETITTNVTWCHNCVDGLQKCMTANSIKSIKTTAKKLYSFLEGSSNFKHFRN